MQSIINILNAPVTSYEPLDEGGKLRKTSLSGRAFIVTGAASGIGRATALMLALQGCRLALTDKDTAGGRSVCEEIKELGKVDVVFATLDITNDTDVGKLVRTFHKTYRKIDGLVNCAGINLPLPVAHETTLERFKQTMDVNLQGTFSMSSHYLREVLSPNNQNEAPRGGYAIVNVGSMASIQGLANMSAYCASKHAIVGLSKTMAKEYATRHVRVNIVAPGAIETPLLEALLDQAPHASGDVSDTIPMRRIGQAEEVASVICFLLGPESGYVTGAVLPVDGGVTL